jgi:hypothetical protein
MSTGNPKGRPLEEEVQKPQEIPREYNRNSHPGSPETVPKPQENSRVQEPPHINRLSFFMGT